MVIPLSVLKQILIIKKPKAMKKIFILILFVVISSFGFAQSLYKTTVDVNVRAAPVALSRIEGVLEKDTEVDVYKIHTNNNYDWAKIRYKNRDAYVSMEYLTLIKTAEQIKAEKKAAAAPKVEKKEAPWYDPMSWGAIGWILIWFVLPVFVLGFGLLIPLTFFARIRTISNTALGVLAVIGGLYLLDFYISCFQIFKIYRGDGGTAILWFLGIATGLGAIGDVINNRCPRCRYNNSNIIYSYITRVTRTTTTTYRDGHEDVSRSSRDTVNNRRRCPECGYNWWTRE